MIVRTAISRITCTVPHRLSPSVRKAIEGCHVFAALVQSSRSVQIRERKVPFLSGGIPSLEQTLSDTFQIYATPDQEPSLMQRIITAAGLEMADRGTIYSQTVDMIMDEDDDERSVEAVCSVETSQETLSGRVPIVDDLASIRCIVQRGQGSSIARIALEMGTSVPSVMFGIGTGGRDRLGLLRIAIPAEKELVTVASPRRDAEILAQRIVEQGGLDRPGTGFVYLHPLQRGLVNIRLWTGSQRHAASINQLVAAVDALWGDTAWRRRFPGEEPPQPMESAGLVRDQQEITIVCPEPQTRTLLQAAMAQGAGGATTTHVAQFGSGLPDPVQISGALEVTTVVVPSSRIEDVLQALVYAHRPDETTAPSIFVGPAPWAYAYRR
jgi:hypothetical protein